ncbi:MAG: hypothetical protein P3B76_06755 [Gemmatimonadota bacterium]|nr:hypothetical protein [Gemmatimonadota bacterium]MDQ8167337.1 hypothetical protein [Gemmatimonadota bacterium]MDQ8172367.1 hypothetical protein [Gemmatimonadota bacterium]
MMTTLSRFRTFAAASFSLLALAACAGSDDPAGPVTPANGTLTVTVSGLPAGVNASVTVTGPSSYTQSPTTSATYSVAPGTYTVAAAQVIANNVRYNAAVTGSPATVTSSATATATVTYALTANPTVTLSGSIAANRTLTPDTNYVLRGFVYVNSGATLTINAGTKIVGDTTALGSALFVLRGARIVANGTEAAPVVFTSQRSAGNRSPGDWGGLIIVGNGRANRTGNIIVEGSNGSVVGANQAGTIYTGGTVDTDNSGTLRYVRVEFAGYATLTDAELNSFTFAAVGSGTTVEYVQALNGLDDNFEWFGGSVNGKYLVSYEAGDDHFDGSEGYRGLNQFMIGLQSFYATPRAGAGAVSTDPQGFEIDGCNGGGCVAPSGANAQSAGRDEGLYNMNVFANFTLIGTPTGVTVPGSGGVGAVFRRGTGGYYLNGVLARWPRAAISLRDSTSNNRFQVDSLIVRNLYFAENGVLASGANFDATGSNFGQESAFAARNSNIVVGAGTVTAASLFTSLPTASGTTTAANFDWSPAAGSPIATGGLNSFAADPRIAARVGTFITPTAYRGAAAPGGAKWWANWTNYARN